MTSPEQSLITDEHRAAVGRKSEPIEIVVKEEDARRIRDLLGDTDPRWAEGTGIAPPYIMATLEPTLPWQMVPRVLPNGILTQTEWRMKRHFRIGERLKAVHQVLDIRDRLGGRYGYSVLITMTTDYFDEAGEHVASTLRTITQFDPKGARGGDEE